MSREAFEKWWTEQYSAHRLNQTQSIGGDLTGIYVDPRAERSWQAWQAAQAQAPEPVAVADKGIINWIDGKQFDHEADLYTQPAVNQQLLEALEYYAEYFDGSVGNKARAAIEAAKETPPAAQVNQQLPEGYVLTPTEPTEAMIDAGVAVAFAASVHGKGGWNNYMNALYRAFIAAAQEQK